MDDLNGKKVLVDTCFLISLVNEDDVFHNEAEAYFREFMNNGVLLMVSSISLSEFYENQEDLEIQENFQILPFGFDETSALHRHFSRADVTGNGGNDRIRVKDDIKIVATGLAHEVDYVLSANADFNSVARGKSIEVIDYSVSLDEFLGRLPNIA